MALVGGRESTAAYGAARLVREGQPLGVGQGPEATAEDAHGEEADAEAEDAAGEDVPPVVPVVGDARQGAADAPEDGQALEPGLHQQQDQPVRHAVLQVALKHVRCGGAVRW